MKKIYTIKESTLNDFGDSIRAINNSKNKMTLSQMKEEIDKVPEKLKNSIDKEDAEYFANQEYCRGLDLGIHTILFAESEEPTLANFPNPDLHYITGSDFLDFVISLDKNSNSGKIAINRDEIDDIGQNVTDEATFFKLQRNILEHTSKTIQLTIPFNKLKECLMYAGGDGFILCENNIDELKYQVQEKGYEVFSNDPYQMLQELEDNRYLDSILSYLESDGRITINN